MQQKNHVIVAKQVPDKEHLGREPCSDTCK